MVGHRVSQEAVEKRKIVCPCACQSQSQSQSQSHFATDGRSVSQYVLVSSPNMGLLSRDFLFFLKVSVLSFLGRPL
jgi:hypothetical protein